MAVTPSVAWAHMVAGNKRFVEGRPQHPRQNVEHRNEIAASQNPEVALFGCADSRLSAEIIFDKGLGDLFDSLKPAIDRIRLREGLEPTAELDASLVGQEHLRDTVSVLLSSSELISQAIAEGRLGLVGANYTLAEGVVTPDVIIGAVDQNH
jgi:carbonic anhydrase